MSTKIKGVAVKNPLGASKKGVAVPPEFEKLGFELGTVCGQVVPLGGLQMVDQTLMKLHHELVLGRPQGDPAALVTLAHFMKGFHQALELRATRDQAKDGTAH